MDTLENNGRPRRKLNHQEFYAVCECLKKNKQEFLDGRPKAEDAAAKLSALTGHTVSESAIADLKAATCINWEPRHLRSSAKSARSNAIRTIAVSLFRLYRKLGEEVPQALGDLYEEVSKRDAPTP